MYRHYNVSYFNTYFSTQNKKSFFISVAYVYIIINFLNPMPRLDLFHFSMENKMETKCTLLTMSYPLKRKSRLQQTTFINIFSLFFREKDLMFQVNPLLGRGFT